MRIDNLIVTRRTEQDTLGDDVAVYFLEATVDGETTELLGTLDENLGEVFERLLLDLALQRDCPEDDL